jgi:hypothetical protein
MRSAAGLNVSIVPASPIVTMPSTTFWTIEAIHSLSRRSVRSRVTFTKPRSSPSSPRMAVMSTLAQKRVRSLRRRQPSSSYVPVREAMSSSRSGLRARSSSSG